MIKRGAETIFSKTEVYDELMKRTDKRGPDSCIDDVAARPPVMGPPTPCSTRSRRHSCAVSGNKVCDYHLDLEEAPHVDLQHAICICHALVLTEVIQP